MADKAPTVGELAEWPTIKEASARAAKHHNASNGGVILWQLIHLGHVETWARRWSRWTGDRGVPEPIQTPRKVTVKDWNIFNGALPSNLWRGEATFAIPQDYSMYAPTSWVGCIDIRCNPADLDREFPTAAPQAEVPSLPQEPERAEPSKGTPISDAMLAEWATLFRKAYPVGSEQMAIKSAAGMFQGHSVPRKKLRDALAKAGKLPPGRPAKS